jgi:hypothetical protein
MKMTTFYEITGRCGRTAMLWNAPENKWVQAAMNDGMQTSYTTRAEAEADLQSAQDDDVDNIAVSEVIIED